MTGNQERFFIALRDLLILYNVEINSRPTDGPGSFMDVTFLCPEESFELSDWIGPDGIRELLSEQS